MGGSCSGGCVNRLGGRLNCERMSPQGVWHECLYNARSDSISGSLTVDEGRKSG